MKKIILILTLLVPVHFALVSCDDDKVDKNKSVFVDDEEMTDFDIWLDENYRMPYNIAFKYKYHDIEADLTFNLVPAKYDDCIAMAKLVKLLWLEPYEEVAPKTFMPTFSPRVIHLIGSRAWESNSTFRLGTAEDGLKVTLFVVNELDPDDIDLLNEFYFKTMHHEFAHILHQTIDYPTEFNLISAGDFTAAWFNRDYEENESSALGFVSNYAGSAPAEDFVETFAYYITASDEKWNGKLEQAGEEGREKILRKLQIVKSYMSTTWKFDVDELRDVLQRRYQDIPLLGEDLYKI